MFVYICVCVCLRKCIYVFYLGRCMYLSIYQWSHMYLGDKHVCIYKQMHHICILGRKVMLRPTLVRRIVPIGNSYSLCLQCHKSVRNTASFVMDLLTFWLIFPNTQFGKLSPVLVFFISSDFGLIRPFV